MPRWPLSQEERFWSYVDKSKHPKGCWLWTGPLDSHGYGQLTWNGRLSLATRVMITLTGYVFKPRECALHACDNPPCVRFAKKHLFVGTKKDNSDDMKAKGRERKAMGDRNASRLYPERRPRGERSGMSRFTNAEVLEIKNSKESGPVLAARFKTSRSIVNKMKSGESWSHLNGIKI